MSKASFKDDIPDSEEKQASDNPKTSGATSISENIVTTVTESNQSNSLSSTSSKKIGDRVATGSIPLSKLGVISNMPPTTPDKLFWSAKQDESLMIAVLEERKARADRGGKRVSGKEHVVEEDWDVMEWDLIAESVSGKTAVECLKRYLKLKKTHDVAKAASGSADIAAVVEKMATGVSPSLKAPKRNLVSTVVASEQMIVPPKRVRIDPLWSDAEIDLLNTLTEQIETGQ